MNVDPIRGVKLGAGGAIAFAIVTPINRLLQHEPVVVFQLLVGIVFAFIFFGVIGTFRTMGADVGDA